MNPSGQFRVIGAGVVGAACAHALAERGYPVTVYRDGSRSTTAVSGGHLLIQSKRPGPKLDMALRSRDLLLRFVKGREEALGFRETGSLILAAGEDEEGPLRAHFEALVAEGVPLRWLSGAEVRNLEPELSDEVTAASYCPWDAQVHPLRLAEAWLDAAVELGATVCETQVNRIVVQEDPRRACGIETETGPEPATAVILAAGPWCRELAATAGVELDVRPRRGVLLGGRAARVLASGPLLGAEYLTGKFGSDPYALAFSFQQHPDGECVLGGTREFTGFSSEGVEEQAARIRRHAARYLPAVGEVEWERIHSGFRPWTPDGFARVGFSGLKRFYLATGFEGDGVMLAAAAARDVLAALDLDLPYGVG